MAMISKMAMPEKIAMTTRKIDEALDENKK